ncbi:MAG: hypothetical protein GXX82_15080 [Syntrophorhabdus sp.]|nr:hypothetical protein [Syntrophorhabdus sp.]
MSRYVVAEPVNLEAEFERLAGYERRREELGRKMEEQMGRVLMNMRGGVTALTNICISSCVREVVLTFF